MLLKNLISLHPLQCGTLITYAAVCHLIVAIVMLIRAPHAEKRRGTNLSCLFCLFSPHQESAAICTFSPASLPPSHPLSLSAFTSSSPLSLLHLLHPSFCVSVLYVFYNCSNNQLIWKTLNYQATSNLPTVCPAPPNQCRGGGAYTLLCATYNSHITTHRGKPNHFEDEFKRDPQFEYISISTCRNK